MKRTGLWHHHDFRQLWLGDTVSVFGMQLVGLALPLMAVQLLGAGALQMGVLSAVQMLAFLLIGLPAGAWVDRWRKKRVLVLGDLTRAGLLLTLPLAWLGGVLSMWQLYVVAFATGCVTVFFDVANQSYLPELVEPEQIADGNGRLQASQQTALIAGPAAAAALVRWVGSPLTIAVTSVCMAASSLFVSRIRHVEQRPDPAQRRPLAREVAEGLRFVRGQPLLVRITACTGLSNFANAWVDALVILYALRVLGLRETDIGLVFSAAAVGGLLAAVTAARAARVVGEGRIIPVAAVLMAVTGLSTPLAAVWPPVPTLVVGGFLGSWAVIVYNITQVSFRQRLCPRRLLGRMNASVRFLVWGPIPLGALLGGVAGHRLGLLPAVWVGVSLFAVSALPVLFSPLLRMRELPRSLDALAG